MQSAAVVRIGNARTDPCLGHSHNEHEGGVRDGRGKMSSRI